MRQKPRTTAQRRQICAKNTSRSANQSGRPHSSHPERLGDSSPTDLDLDALISKRRSEAVLFVRLLKELAPMRARFILAQHREPTIGDDGARGCSRSLCGSAKGIHDQMTFLVGEIARFGHDSPPSISL